MEGRIDPPSSMKQLTVNTIAAQCCSGEVWVDSDEPNACVFLNENEGRLYLGKLVVSRALRGRGVARQLIEFAEERAIHQGLRELEIEVRIELIENHKAFEKLGFAKVSEGTHVGYDKPTFITMRKQLGD